MHPFGRGITSVCVYKVEVKPPAIIAEFNPIVTRFPPEDRVRLSEADRMQKEEKKHGKKDRERERERKREIDKEGDIARRGEEQKEAIPTVTRNGDT